MILKLTFGPDGEKLLALSTNGPLGTIRVPDSEKLISSIRPLKKKARD